MLAGVQHRYNNRTLAQAHRWITSSWSPANSSAAHVLPILRWFVAYVCALFTLPIPRDAQVESG